jgi:hypothetical protein
VSHPRRQQYSEILLFSSTLLPALWPTQPSVHCVQLLFGGDHSGQGVNLNNRLSPLPIPKFIFKLSEHDVSIFRPTPTFRWKLKTKESLYDEVSFILRFVGGKELQVLTAHWLVKVCRNTLIATSGFCKRGHENTGFDKLQKLQLFKKLHTPRSVYLLWRHVCLESSCGGFSVFYPRTSSPGQTIFF